MNNLEKLKAAHAKLGKEIEALEATKRWNPEHGDWYWAADCCGFVDKNLWRGDEVDVGNYTMGNVFKTREEAERHKGKQLLRVELQDFADFVPDWGGTDEARYYIYHDHVSSQWGWGYACSGQYPDTIYFATEERAHEAIEHFGDRLELLL